MDPKIESLIGQCHEIRQWILKIVGFSPNEGHLGGALSIVEILAALYLYPILRFKKSEPDDPNRDLFVLSKGHASAAFYAALAQAGLISQELLLTFRHNGSILQGHPHRGDLSWIDYSGGVLGGGLSYAHGLCLAAEMTGRRPPFVVCLLGDGECNEGQIWEALGTISHQSQNHRAPHLCVIVDWNKVQLDGSTKQIKNLDLEALFGAFGLPIRRLNGHDLAELIKVLLAVRDAYHGPSIILADTIKGRGVKTMEQGGAKFHGPFPKDFTLDQALAELEEVRS